MAERRDGGTYHHGDLRNALLEAARELVEERGHDRLSLRGVASRVGVSHMAPYHHFEDKRALLGGVAAEGFRELARAMRRRSERAEGAAERLREVGVAYVVFAVENPNLFRLMFSGVLPDGGDLPELAAAGRDAYALLADALRSLRSAGPPGGGDGDGDAPAGGGEPDGRGGPAPPDDRALRAWSLVHGLASLIVDGQLGGGMSPERAEGLAYRVLAAR